MSDERILFKGEAKSKLNIKMPNLKKRRQNRNLQSPASNDHGRQSEKFEIRSPERLVANDPNSVEPFVRNFVDQLRFVEKSHRLSFGAADVIDSGHQRRVLK